MGHFMGPGAGPSMDRVYINKGAGAPVRQLQHAVMPLVCLEMQSALIYCASANAEVVTEELEAEHMAGDQASMAPFERGVFEVTDRDVNQVPPYQNNPFIQHVNEEIATFNRVSSRAAPSRLSIQVEQHTQCHTTSHSGMHILHQDPSSLGLRLHISPADTSASHSVPQAPKSHENLAHELVPTYSQHISP